MNEAVMATKAKTTKKPFMYVMKLTRILELAFWLVFNLSVDLSKRNQKNQYELFW